MTHSVITIDANQSILDAAQLMLDRKISGLPVLDENKHLIGIITESDIFRMLVNSHRPEEKSAVIDGQS